MSGSQYFLLRHVYLCRCRDKIVILDVKHHRYRALDAEKLSGLETLVAGWPTYSEDDAPGTAGSTAAEQLVTQGILCTDPKSGKDATPVWNLKPIGSVVSGNQGRVDSIQLTVVSALLWAFASSWTIYHVCSLGRLIRILRARKEALMEKQKPFDLELARKLVRIFVLVMPFLSRSRNNCLFHSLVLNKFLARYGIYADWVFGVRVKPWLAHSWLQRDGYILGDTVETVDFLTPLMVV